MERHFILIGVWLALTGVVLGAFGAHLLQDSFSPDQQRWYTTAVNYHMTHALGLILCGLTASTLGASRTFNRACLCLFLGTLIFSGSLYLMSLTNQRWLGAVTPIGGIAFILGWLFFAKAVRSSPARGLYKNAR